MSITVIPQGGTRHADVIQGLENAAAFLATHPDLPLGGSKRPLYVSASAGDDEENRAEVDRIAAILGVPARDPYGDGTYYEAERDFGGGIAYRAIAITADAMDQWYAVMDYRDALRTGKAAAA